ncbi:MAG: hypothetical protein ACOZCP_09455 [Pseudomonadota bacterium]
MPITDSPLRRARLWPAMAAACLALAATLASAEEAFQVQTVDGIVVRLQVASSRPHGPADSTESPHRVTVVLRDKATGRPIADASVAVEVAKTGRAGARWSLTPGTADGGPAYVGQVPMAGRGTAYRVLVQFRRPGDTETFEAEFRFAHH